jgi:hypothetical protein
VAVVLVVVIAADEARKGERLGDREDDSMTLYSQEDR